MNAPQTITINLVITPDSSKPLRKAVTKLLELIAPDNVVDDQSPPHPLADVWLTESEVHKFADATGQSRGMATKAVTSVRHAILHKASDYHHGELLPAFFESRHSDSKSVRADDFVVIIQNDACRQALREQIGPFGPKAENVAILMAGWLEDIYGKLDA